MKRQMLQIEHENLVKIPPVWSHRIQIHLAHGREEELSRDLRITNPVPKPLSQDSISKLIGTGS